MSWVWGVGGGSDYTVMNRKREGDGAEGSNKREVPQNLLRRGQGGTHGN